MKKLLNQNQRDIEQIKKTGCTEAARRVLENSDKLLKLLKYGKNEN